MQSAHQFADMCRSVVSTLTSTSTKSQFVEKGFLTAAEFVEAGDQLVFKFPTWQWQSAGERRQLAWLPADKQYLITRNVPCRARVKDLDCVLTTNNQTEANGWLIPGDDPSPTKEDEAIEIGALSIDDTEKPPASRQVNQVENFITDPSTPGDAPDMSSFTDVDDLLLEEDDAAAAPSSAAPKNDVNKPGYFVCSAPDSELVSSRTYDLSITYDKYYQTPRLWLFGYDENGSPLTPEQIFEDVLSDYATKTVTVDPHPITAVPTASIHPCRHAAVMKKVVDGWIENGTTPRHDLALFVFLKFLSSVVPTINYDFTMDIEMAIGHSLPKK